MTLPVLAVTALIIFLIIMLLPLRMIMVQISTLQSSVNDLRRHIMDLEYNSKEHVGPENTNAGDTSRHHKLY